MWLVVSLLAATTATVACLAFKSKKAYHLDWLCLMLWGLATMVLVDRSIGVFVEGDEFIEITTEGYIQDGALLGIAMLMPVFVAWGAMVAISRVKRSSRSLEVK